jgi:hypothetical protein
MAPSAVLPPARFSICTGWPVSMASWVPMVRATMSAMAPAGYGTIQRIGRAGNSRCACAALPPHEREGQCRKLASGQAGHQLTRRGWS